MGIETEKIKEADRVFGGVLLPNGRIHVHSQNATTDSKTDSVTKTTSITGNHGLTLMNGKIWMNGKIF